MRNTYMGHPRGYDPTSEQLAELVRETPPSGKKRPLGMLAAAATLGSLLFGYDTGVIAGALPYMYMPMSAGGLAISDIEEGLVGAFLAIGAACGAIVGGQFSDKFGRRTGILLLAVIFVIGTLGCSFSMNVWMLYPFRFILGWAVGGASSTVPIYLAENAPKRIRGPLVAMDQFMIVFGQLVAYTMNAAISSHHGGPELALQGKVEAWDKAKILLDKTPSLVDAVTGGNGSAWRWMLVLATIPAIALWIGMRMMPESARWYASNGDYVDAIGSLKRIRDDDKDDVTAEVEQMVDVHRAESEVDRWTLARAIRTKWTRKLIIIGLFLGFFDQLTGINTAMYYLPKILSAAGFSLADSITLNVVTGAISCVGAAVGLLLVARFTRRHVGMYQEAGITISLTVLALVFAYGISPHMLPDGEVASTMPIFLPWLVLILVSIFVFIKQSGTVCWVLVSEIFPARIHGVAQGFAVGGLWLMNAIVTAAFPPMITHFGPAWTYAIFALINLAAFLFYWKKVPETKTSTLEELEVTLKQLYS